MGAPMNGGEKDEYNYDVHPTGQTSATNQYSDTALTNLFVAHVSLVNSERQAIWQRYSVMLAGNSLLLGFLFGKAKAGLEPIEMIFAVIFGWTLCVLWGMITSSGYKYFNMLEANASRFVWRLGPEANPIAIGYKYEKGSLGGWIYYAALGLILSFAVAYGLVLADFYYMRTSEKPLQIPIAACTQSFGKMSAEVTATVQEFSYVMADRSGVLPLYLWCAVVLYGACQSTCRSTRWWKRKKREE